MQMYHHCLELYDWQGEHEDANNDEYRLLKLVGLFGPIEGLYVFLGVQLQSSTHALYTNRLPRCVQDTDTPYVLVIRTP